MTPTPEDFSQAKAFMDPLLPAASKAQFWLRFGPDLMEIYDNKIIESLWLQSEVDRLQEDVARLTSTLKHIIDLTEKL